ncbi:hypothetical protein HMPREF1430_00249 [Helicobacter pylori GAM96Ai]|nr:hypothetical protein HMPREF1430_00249 [Helicobacter pylori GAM96Ai]
MILFVSLFLVNTAIGMDKTDSRRFIETNAIVTSCSICEKRKKELEEQGIQSDPILPNEPKDSNEPFQEETRSTTIALPQSVISKIAESFHRKNEKDSQ